MQTSSGIYVVIKAYTYGSLDPSNPYIFCMLLNSSGSFPMVHNLVAINAHLIWLYCFTFFAHRGDAQDIIHSFLED